MCHKFKQFKKTKKKPQSPQKENIKTYPKSLSNAPSLTPEQQKSLEYNLTTLKLSKNYALIFAQNQSLTQYLNEALINYAKAQSLANWIINHLLKECQATDSFPITPKSMALFVQLIDEHELSSKIAKEIFSEMLTTKKSAQEIFDKQDFQQIDALEELSPLIDEVIQDFPELIEQIQAGRKNRLGFLVGQVIQRSQGKANPKLVAKLLQKRI